MIDSVYNVSSSCYGSELLRELHALIVLLCTVGDIGIVVWF